MKCENRYWLLAVVAATAASPVSVSDPEAFLSWPWPSKSPPSQAPQPDLVKAAAVKQVFQTAWAGYKQYAFPHDELTPLNNGFVDDRNGWGATAVDGLDTAIIMEDVVIVNEILDYIPKINFNTTAVANQQVSFFETTIRYLGGMLSAYDLLTGPYSHLPHSQDQVKTLLKQAKAIADSLKVAFTTPSGVPDGTLYFNPTHKTAGSATNSAAGAGSLILEWTRLSDLTGDDQYAQLAAKAESFLLNPTGVPGPWPGLIGTDINLQNGQFVDATGSWGASSDSGYEYMIKAYLYDPKTFEKNKDRWVLAAESTIAHLASHPTTRPQLTFLSAFNGTQTIPSSQHLVSFAGGNFILGGVLLNNQEFRNFGINLTLSYYQTYNATATGIGPELFDWVDDALPIGGGNNPSPPASQKAFYDTAGFWITNGQYILRPETMESIYYAYRLTGDRAYQQLMWDAFQAVSKTTRAGSGYACLQNVNAPGGGGFTNTEESFLYAEVLKYSYLAFAPDSAVQFQQGGNNQFVFNTEAHPLRVRS